MAWIAPVIGGGLSLLSSLSGAGAASDAEKTRALAGFDKNTEDVRRRKLETDRQIGSAIALTEGATGVRNTAESTNEAYIKNLRLEYGQELAWQRRYGASVLAAGMSTADANYRTDLMRGLSGSINTGLSIYSALS